MKKIKNERKEENIEGSKKIKEKNGYMLARDNE